MKGSLEDGEIVARNLELGKELVQTENVRHGDRNLKVKAGQTRKLCDGLSDRAKAQ